MFICCPGPRPAGFWGRCKADCSSSWSGHGANVVKQKVRCQRGSQGCWRPEEVILRGLVKWKLIIALSFREYYCLVLASVYRSALYFRKQFNVTHCSSAGQTLQLNLELYIEMPYLVLLCRCTFPYTAAWLWHMTQIHNEQQPLTNRRVHRTGFFQRAE